MPEGHSETPSMRKPPTMLEQDSHLANSICQSDDPTVQLQALRSVKNQIIGHEQKKQDWLRLGLLESLLEIVRAARPQKNINVKPSKAIFVHGTLSAEEEIQLQAVLIIGSLANGGNCVLSPLQASTVVAPLLALLEPRSLALRLLLATLETLNILADSFSINEETRAYPEQGWSSAVFYEEPNPQNFCNLIRQAPATAEGSRLVTQVASLIAKTRNEDSHRNVLVQSGILEALASKLCRWIKLTANAGVRRSRLHERSASFYEQRSCLVPGRLSTLLLTISLIIEQSISRAQYFLQLPCLADTFEQVNRGLPAPNGNTLLRGRNSRGTVMDELLPLVPTSTMRNGSGNGSGMPPFDHIKVSNTQWPRSLSTAVEIFSSQGLENLSQPDYSLTPWLIYIARTADEVTSMMAMGLLASLHNLRLVKASRETSIALLVIPLLVRLLASNKPNPLQPMSTADRSTSTAVDNIVKEEAPAILAIFAINNQRLQKAAVEAGAITELAELIKQSYSSTNVTLSVKMWSAGSGNDQDVDMTDGSQAQTSRVAHSPRLNHAIKVRETTLIALAALASDRDEYRKAIVEAGIIPLIVRTLKAEDVPFESASGSHTRAESLEDKLAYGTCREAILAACGAARALSRSVSTLRTSLMEQGLPQPLFALLSCTDVGVQTAATAVISNLALHFSPMRDALVDGGIIPILCQHAHSSNLGLRLNSLWVLKHLVIEATTGIKTACMKGLSPAWLKDLINNDVESPTPIYRDDREELPATPVRLSTSNAIGEQVDLLNAIENRSRESSAAPEADSEEDLRMSDGVSSFAQKDGGGKLLHAPTLTPSRLRESGTPSQHDLALPIEVAMIKQGLEFLRNLMAGDDLSEMIDLILKEFGQEDFFKILCAKLRPRAFNAFDRNRKSSLGPSGIQHVQPQPEIAKSASYLLVHIAASHSRHRQLLMGQHQLLNLIPSLFDHQDPDIRVCATWLVINLTWEDDGAEKAACRERARRLMSLGIFEKLQRIEAQDTSLDCRERAKNALHQISSLLRLP